MSTNEQDIADGLTALYLAQGQIDTMHIDENEDNIHSEKERLTDEYGPIVGGFFGSSAQQKPPNLPSNEKKKKRRRPKQENTSSTSDKTWVGGSIPVSERRIPQYDAVNDPHCAYTKFSGSFQSSPFATMKRESKSTIARWVPKPDSSHNDYARSLPRMPMPTGSSMSHSQHQMNRSMGDLDQRMKGKQSINHHAAPSTLAPKSDPSDRLNSFRQESLEAIEARELLLRNLMSTDRNQQDIKGHASMVRLLRAAALRCTETIAAWHRAFRRAMLQTSDADRKNGEEEEEEEEGESSEVFNQEGEDMSFLGPIAFEWRNINYLTKMANDSIEPVGRVQGVVDALPPHCNLYRNPFLLEHNLDDIDALVVPPIVSESSKSGMSHGIELLRLRRAARLILAEETLRGVYRDEDVEGDVEGDVEEVHQVRAHKPPSANKPPSSSSSRKQSHSKTSSSIKPNYSSKTTTKMMKKNAVVKQTKESSRKRPGVGNGVPPMRTKAAPSLLPPTQQPPGRSKPIGTRLAYDDERIDDHQEEFEEEGGGVNDTFDDIRSSHINPNHSGGGQTNLNQSERFARLASGVPALHPSPPVIPLAELEALAKLTSPPIPVVVAFAAARVLLSQNVHVLPNLKGTNPSALRSILRRPKILARQLQTFNLLCPIRPAVVKVLKPIVMNPKLSVMDIQRDSPCAAALFAWVKKVVLQHLQRVGEKLPDPNKVLLHRLHHGSSQGHGAPLMLGGSNGSFNKFLTSPGGGSGGKGQLSLHGSFLDDPYFQDSFADVEMEDEFFQDEYGVNGSGGTNQGGYHRKNPGLSLSRNSEMRVEDLDERSNIMGGGVDYGGDLEEDEEDDGNGRQESRVHGDEDEDEQDGGDEEEEDDDEEEDRRGRRKRDKANRPMTLKEKKLHNERIARLTSEASSSGGGGGGSALPLTKHHKTQAKAQAEIELSMLDTAASQMLRSLQTQIIGLRSELAKRGMLEKEAKFATPVMTHEAWGVPVATNTATNITHMKDNEQKKDGGGAPSTISPYEPPTKVFFRPGRVLLWSGEISAPIGGKETLLELRKKFTPATDIPTPLEYKKNTSHLGDEEDEKERKSNSFADEAVKIQAAKEAAEARAISKNKRKNAGSIRKFEVQIYAIPSKGNTSQVLIEAMDANSVKFQPYASLKINAVIIEKLCHVTPQELSEMLPKDRELKIGPLIASLTIEELMNKNKSSNRLNSSSSSYARAKRLKSMQETETIFYDRDFPDLIALPKDAMKMAEKEQSKKLKLELEEKEKIKRRIALRKADRKAEKEEKKARGEYISDDENDEDNEDEIEQIDSADDETTDSDDERNILKLNYKNGLKINEQNGKVHFINEEAELKKKKDLKKVKQKQKLKERKEREEIENYHNYNKQNDENENENDENDEQKKKKEIEDLADSEPNFSIVLLVDRLCHRSSITISQRAYEVRASRREGNSDNDDENNDDESGISFILWPCANGRGPMDRLQLFVSDKEIELLLIGQPALFHRMLRKWSALEAVTSWLIKRLKIQKKDKKLGIDVDSLWLLRSIQLPNRLSKGWCLNGHKKNIVTGQIVNSKSSKSSNPNPNSVSKLNSNKSLNKYDVLGGSRKDNETTEEGDVENDNDDDEEEENEIQQFVMRLRQKGNSLILTVVAVPPLGTKEYLKFEQTSSEEDEEEEMKAMNSHTAPPLLQSSPCILNIPIEEIRAFIGLPAPNLKTNDLPPEDDEAFISLLDNINSTKATIYGEENGNGSGGGSNNGGTSFDKLMARVSLIPAPPMGNMQPNPNLNFSSSSSSSFSQQQQQDEHDDFSDNFGANNLFSFSSPNKSNISSINNTKSVSFGGSPTSQNSGSPSNHSLGGGGGGYNGGISELTARSGVAITIDRTLSVEVREVSGIPCSVTASACGDDILFTAVRVGQLDVPELLSSSSSSTNNRKQNKRKKDGEDDDEDNGVGGDHVLPIPPSQLALPLRKLVSMADAAQLLTERVRLPSTQAAALIHASHRKELALILVPQLKIVVKQRRLGEGTPAPATATTAAMGKHDLSSSSPPLFPDKEQHKTTTDTETRPVAELETALYQSLYMLTVCIDGESRRNRIGCIEVDDQATLAAVRKQITQEFDIEDIPQSYRFRFNDAPCARKQESMRLACSCAPNLVLYSRDPSRDAKYHKMESLHPQGDPNDLFYDDDGFNAALGGTSMLKSPPSSTSRNYFPPDDDEDNENGGGVADTEDEMAITKKKRKRKKKKNEDDEGKVTDSDEDPPPGPSPPRKPPKESGMERRARLRREKRKSKRDAKALRLKRPPDAASGRLHDAPEPIVPDPVLFVPVPLPSVVTVVQGLDEIWATSLIDLNGMLTGDDILRIGTVDSADYPVKARSDDVVRRRKPKPPPWHLRPGAVTSSTDKDDEKKGGEGEGDEDQDEDDENHEGANDMDGVEPPEGGGDNEATGVADAVGDGGEHATATMVEPTTPPHTDDLVKSPPQTASSKPPTPGSAMGGRRSQLHSSQSNSSESQAVKKGMSNRQIQRRKALERARELAAAAAELEVGALNDYEAKLKASIGSFVASGGVGDVTLLKELHSIDCKIQRHDNSSKTLDVLNSALKLLIKKKKKKEKKRLKKEMKRMAMLNQEGAGGEDEASIQSTKDKKMKENSDDDDSDDENKNKNDDSDSDDSDDDEEDNDKMNSNGSVVIEEVDRPGFEMGVDDGASQISYGAISQDKEPAVKLTKEQLDNIFKEECIVASMKQEAEEKSWIKSEEYCDLFRELTPRFGPRTSGISWYPKKEALDEILDIAELNSQANIKNNRRKEYGDDDEDDEDDMQKKYGKVANSSKNSHKELMNKLKKKKSEYGKVVEELNIGLGPRPPAKFIPKGKYGQLAVDFIPLIEHSHHLVHSAALSVIRELARGLRQSFYTLCNGEQLLITILHRTREKKLRIIIDDVLDVFFATGAVQISSIIETVIPNILDPTVDANKPIVRLTVWRWLRRCLGRTDPNPDAEKALQDSTVPSTLLPSDGGSKILLRDTRSKILLLQIASRGIMTDYLHVNEATDLMYAVVDMVARGTIRAAAIPPLILHEHHRFVAATAQKRKTLLIEAAQAEIVLDEVAAGRAATPVTGASSLATTSMDNTSTINTGGVPTSSLLGGNSEVGGGGGMMDDDDDDDDDDDSVALKLRKEYEALANEPPPEVLPDDSVGQLARMEILVISLYLEKLSGTCDPNSRLSDIITSNKQRLMEMCASILGISLELEVTDEDDDDYYGGSRGGSRSGSRSSSRPGSKSSHKRNPWNKEPSFSPDDPWLSGEISPPWWLPSPNELAERRKKLEEAAAIALAAATKEPPLKIKERLDRQIKEMREDLEASMRAKNFMQCLSIQKGIDQLKFDRRNIPGLSEELVAITSLQSFIRGMAGRKQMKELKFQQSLPPSPWITVPIHDPQSNSELKYYWEPYRDYSTWDLQETGIELRKEMEARAVANAFGFFYQKAQENQTEKERIGARENATMVGTSSLRPQSPQVASSAPYINGEADDDNSKIMPTKPKNLQRVYLDVLYDVSRKKKVLRDLKQEVAKEALIAAQLEEEEEAKKKVDSDDENGEVGGKKGGGHHHKHKKKSNDIQDLVPGTAAYALAALQASAGTVDLSFGSDVKLGPGKAIHQPGTSTPVGGATAGALSPSPSSMPSPGGATLISRSQSNEELEFLDVIEEPDIGTTFDNQRLWRLIPKDQDARPTWRIHYDSGRVNFDFEYGASRKKVTHFRVPQRYCDLEPLVVDDWRALLDSGKDFRTKPMHVQRLDHFLNVSPKKILTYAYQMVGHSWYPTGEGISESKWSKFVKEMKIFPDMHKAKRSAQVELGFKRYIHEQEENMTDKKRQADKAAGIGGRCLNEEYFEKAIVEMVQLRHPKMIDNPSGALQHVLMESVIMMPEVNGKVWNEAKRLSMIEEGKKQSAATRIQALIRKVQRMDAYRTQLRCLVIIQARMRRYRCIMRYATRRRYLLDDLFYRIRWINAIIIQMAFRRFVAIRSFKQVIRVKHDELVAKWKSRRVKQTQRRTKLTKAIMFRRVRTVNGTLTMQEMTRSSKGTLGDDDFGVLLTVYTPSNQRYFKFDIPDTQFRDFIYQATGKIKFSGNELLEPRYLRIVCDRLMCRVIDGAPIIYMSKKSTAERGVQIAKKGVNIPGGGRLVVTCYWSNDEVVFQTYDTRDSRAMRTALTMVVLRNWLTDELVWERKRAKRLVNAKRGEARKMLKCETLGIPVPAMHLGWARDFLSKTGGDRDCGIEMWTPDSKPWDAVEVPIDVVLSVDSATSHKLGYQRRMEAEAEMDGWTEDNVNEVTKASIETEAARLHATEVKDGIVPYTDKEAAGINNTERSISELALSKEMSMTSQPSASNQALVVSNSPNSSKQLKTSNSIDSIDDDDEVEEEEDKSKSSWTKEYSYRFPGMPVPPSAFFEDELLEMGEEPPLLRPNRRIDLVNWLLSKLHIARFKQGEKRGMPQLVLAYELDLDNQAEAAARIQGLQRMYKARKRVRHSTKLKYEKRYDRESGSMYYVFVPDEWTKHSAEAAWQWKKPKCLEYRGFVDDCAPPENVWRDMYVHITEEEEEKLAEDPKTKAVKILKLKSGTSQDDGPPCTAMYYMNPATGQTAKISIGQAAVIIQCLVRHFLSREIGRITIKLMIKALKLQFDSEEKYLAFPNRLSSIVNWAMVLHTMHHDLDNAKILYKKAMEISPENPVLLRASALFTLMTCEPPRTSSWQRAMKNLRAAELRDPTREKFTVAEECLFHWAVVCNPKSSRCLLNYALLLQCVVKNYDLAEKFYRRAIAEDADDKLVVRNYLDFEAQRLPGGLYAGGGPPLAVLKTSTIEDEKFDWGEWRLMRNSKAHDQRFQLYWAAELLGKTSWEEPNWNDVWANIVLRSTQTKDLGGWLEWYDPKLKVTFFQNPNTVPPKIQKQSPYHSGDLSKQDRKVASSASTVSSS